MQSMMDRPGRNMHDGLGAANDREVQWTGYKPGPHHITFPAAANEVFFHDLLTTMAALLHPF